MVHEQLRFAVAADHAGFPLKARVAAALEALGHAVSDLGTHDTAPVDYPDVSEAAARAVLAGDADRAVVLCGSGVGASVAANKLPGINAAVCHDTYSARQGVEHDDMNVLCLGTRVIGEELAVELVTAFANAHFDGIERHARRLEKVRALEARALREQ